MRRILIMIDGKFEPGEWDRVASAKVSDSLTWYIQQDDKDIYYCLKGGYSSPSLFVVDFYKTCRKPTNIYFVG